MMNKTATWEDVRQKAYRIVSDNGVDITEISTYSILASVQGDTGVYQVYVNNNAKVNSSNDLESTDWYCTCDWGGWTNTGNRPHDGPNSTGSVLVNDRFCSHAYAAYMVLQAYRKYHKGRNK